MTIKVKQKEYNMLNISSRIGKRFTALVIGSVAVFWSTVSAEEPPVSEVARGTEHGQSTGGASFDINPAVFSDFYPNNLERGPDEKSVMMNKNYSGKKLRVLLVDLCVSTQRWACWYGNKIMVRPLRLEEQKVVQTQLSPNAKKLMRRIGHKKLVAFLDDLILDNFKNKSLRYRCVISVATQSFGDIVITGPRQSTVESLALLGAYGIIERSSISRITDDRHLDILILSSKSSSSEQKRQQKQYLELVLPADGRFDYDNDPAHLAWKNLELFLEEKGARFDATF